MGSETVEFTGHAMDLGWQPHKPETWTHRYARLKEPVTLRHFLGHGKDGPIENFVALNAGHPIKIVMVSRFGDVGITEDLSAETGYGARVYLDVLTDFTKEPAAGPAESSI